MHRFFMKAIATAMAALLFAFPAYAKTERAVVDRPFDIVSATIQNVTFGIHKAEVEAKAEAAKKKAAEEEEAKKKAEAEEAAKKAAEEAAKKAAEAAALAQENQQVQTVAQAAAPEAYTQTSAQVYDTPEQDTDPSQYVEEAQAPETTASYADENAASQQEEQPAAVAQENEASAEEQPAATVQEKQETASEQVAEEAKTEETKARSSSKDNTYEGEKLNAVNGMIEGPSGTETYYNLNMSGVISNMQEMGIQGEYWVRDDGVKMYGDYVMAAANLDTHPYGTIVESSLGEAIVVDTGDFAAYDEDQLDIAVDW